MIVNKKLIQKLISESVHRLINERKLEKAYKKKLAYLTSESVLPRKNDVFSTAGLYTQAGREFREKIGSFMDDINHQNLTQEYLNFANKEISKINKMSIDEILSAVTTTKNSIRILTNLFGDTFKSYNAKAKSLNQLIKDINAGKYTDNPEQGKTLFIDLSIQRGYLLIMNKIVAQLILSENEKKLRYHDKQRKLKKDFITQNKKELKNWLIVHYPGAYSSDDREQANPLILLYNFLKVTIGKSNRHELSGVAYPKDKLRIIDGLGLGGYGGRGDVPYPGVVCDGFITYIYKRDANSSTFLRPYAGGFRGEGEAQSGFVKYPRDLQRAGLSHEATYNPEDYYFKQGELENYREDFLNQIGGKSAEEALKGKFSYNEGIIDNWQPSNVVGAWDNIVAHYKAMLESPDKPFFIVRDTLNTIKKLRLLDIGYLDINFEKIDPESFLGKIESIAMANPDRKFT